MIGSHEGIVWRLLPFLIASGCTSGDNLRMMPPSPQSHSPASDLENPVRDGGTLLDGTSGQDGTTVVTTRPYVEFGINHILVTGQSNSVSNMGRPVLTSTQPYSNVMFDTGVMPMMGSPSNPAGGCDGNGCVSFQNPSGFVPMTEGDGFFQPDAVETSVSSISSSISFLFETSKLPGRHDVLASLHGRSGNTYWCLRKGGCNYKPGYLKPFDQAVMEVTTGKKLAEAVGKSYVVRAVFAIHGESDHYSYTAGLQEFPLDGTDGTPLGIKDYTGALIEWQRDYESMVRSITGQTEPVPLIISQLSGWNDARTSKLAEMQLRAHETSGGKVILAGPSYSLQLNQEDCLHFTSQGENEVGEMLARAYSRVVLERGTWDPVRPVSIVRTGKEIKVRFAVPNPPLVIDNERVASAANLGFDWSPGGISSIALSSDDEITIEIVSDRSGELSYAQNQPTPGCAGTPNGARGNIRDSNSVLGRTGRPQFNWGVHFTTSVP